jgi:DNA-binding transcriptional regulator YiaG
MMKDKKIKTLIYKGLGFPIKLISVPMKKMLGDWVMDIDMTELQIIVLKALVYKPAQLSNNELRFIRHFLQLNTTEFGKIFGVTHSAVVQWEKGTRHASPPIDLCIRLHVMNHLHVKDKEFRQLYNEISVAQLSQNPDKQIPLIKVDASEDLKIAL